MHPTRADLHQKAMQAAISVTLALGVACGQPPQPFEKDPTGTASAADSAEPSGTDTAAGDTASEAADDTAAGDTAAGDTGTPTLGTCVGIVDPAELTACCAALSAACDAAFPDDWEAAYECAWGAASGCTPWGPPVPPVA